jgi:excisionase family DNA binding protein
MAKRKTYVTQAELARRLGVNRQYIYKLVKQGKLKKCRNGKLDLDASLEAIEQVRDPAYASKIDTEAARTPRKKVRRKKVATKATKASKNGDDPPPAKTVPSGPSSRKPTYAESKAMREFWLAKQARQTFLRNERELIPAEEVEKEVFEAFRPVREALLAAPGRMAGVLAPMSEAGEIEAVLMELCREVLEGAVDAIEAFAKTDL